MKTAFAAERTLPRGKSQCPREGIKEGTNSQLPIGTSPVSENKPLAFFLM